MSLQDQRSLCEQISIPDSKAGTEIPITQKDINEDHQTLGVKKTISGQETSQDKFLYLKSMLYGNRIHHSNLNQHQDPNYTKRYQRRPPSIRSEENNIRTRN
jgi:hypothetical protein